MNTRGVVKKTREGVKKSDCLALGVIHSANPTSTLPRGDVMNTRGVVKKILI